MFTHLLTLVVCLVHVDFSPNIWEVTLAQFAGKMAGSETMEETAVTETGESDQPDPERPGRQVEEQTNQPESQVQTTEQSDRLLKLPMSRVKTIIKMDPEVTLASQEAVATLTKAAVRIFMGFCCCFSWSIGKSSMAPGSIV